MKRKALVKHLLQNGCYCVREGSSHSIWKNPENGFIQTVPRHPEVKKFTSRSVCSKLGIPKPKDS